MLTNDSNSFRGWDCNTYIKGIAMIYICQTIEEVEMIYKRFGRKIGNKSGIRTYIELNGMIAVAKSHLMFGHDIWIDRFIKKDFPEIRSAELFLKEKYQKRIV